MPCKELWNRTEIAKTDESIPHERVEFKRLGVAIDGLVGVTVSLPELPLQAVHSCSIR